MKKQYTQKQIEEAISYWQSKLDESKDFSDASTLKVSCNSNPDYDGIFHRDYVEEEMSSFGMKTVDVPWMSFVLGHVFSDANEWTEDLEKAFLKDNVKSMLIMLGNDFVKLEKMR